MKAGILAGGLGTRLRPVTGEHPKPMVPLLGKPMMEQGFVTSCACEDRARLMGTLSELMLDMGAEYDDGIRLRGKDYELHICPSAIKSAVRIAVRSDDAEFARALCLSAKDLAEKLKM